MQQVTTIVQRISAALDDPMQKWSKEPFVRPYLNQAWEDLYAELAQYDIPWPERVRELLNVPLNTNSLAAYAAAGQPLENMTQPVFMEWKQAGVSATRYAPIGRKDRLPDVENTQGHVGYEIRDDGIVYITPSTIATDIRIRFEVSPDELDDLADPIMVGVRNVLVYSTSSFIASVRGMAGLDARLEGKYDEAKQTLEARLVKRRQRVPLRIGSQSRRRRGRVVRVTL